MTEVRVPTLGESVTEATIATWFKKPGDSVAQDEMLCELETDKVTVEVPSPAAGTLADIVAAEGETVGVDALLANISEGASAAAPAPAATPAAAPASDAGVAVDVMVPTLGESVSEATVSTWFKQVGDTVQQDEMLCELETDKVSVEVPAPASGTAPRAPVSADDAPREERVKMTRLRQTIAKRLKDSQNTAAMLTTYNEVDMTEVMAVRKEYKDAFEKKHGARMGFMSFFTKACCHALKEVPEVNAEIDGTDIIYKNYVHMGIAAGTPTGLVVPVIRDADAMSFAEIEKAIAEKGARARDGKLTMAEMQGGTFTISNGGVYGSLMSSPILNPPQSGILGMHKIQERPMAINGQVVIRPMMYLALSYDHRIVDGKGAVTFLVRVKEALEDPRRLLLDL
ncbi:MAG: 2-oxoglutarate dehydrogenase complex dihydrolipoyllysine-residue succinyltransferase [Rhodobacteraceae bacterium]|nr:2-oxoglutarate dehydrogenase complex dihydrolipoyllysine-residue succinyltransferase [Paracoccaceae bacterium]